MAILSNAGGLAVLTTDWCHRLGLSIPPFPTKTVEELRSFLLPIASGYNPIDMTGSADYECYKQVLDAVLKMENIDIIIPIFVSQGLVTSDGPAKAVVEKQKEFTKPILAYWMGGNSITNGVKILKRGEVPVYSSPAKVAKAAAALVMYSDFRKKVL